MEVINVIRVTPEAHTMRVRLFANLAEKTDARELELAVADHPTVGAVIETLVDQHPDLSDDIFDENGDLAPYINVLVNGEAIDPNLDPNDHQLEPGDEIAIFPPVSGG